MTLSAGTLFLLAGVAALSTGWLVPPGLEGVEEDKEEELVVLDVQAVRYNHVPGVCRLLGTALCITAAVLGAVGLLCRMGDSCCCSSSWGPPRLCLSCRCGAAIRALWGTRTERCHSQRFPPHP